MIKRQSLKIKVKELFSASNKGFTLLFAILLSILVLAVGLSIISIALKQVILSGAGRESQFAFYASNTGIECALYWDFHPHNNGGNLEFVFPANFSEHDIEQAVWTDSSNITCLGGEIRTGESFIPNPFIGEEGAYNWDLENNEYKFRLAVTNNVNDSNNEPVNNILYCVDVLVKKTYEETDSGESKIITTITSRGLNTCDPTKNRRAIERGLVLRYES